MNSQNNEYYQQIECIFALCVIVVCSERTRLTLEDAALLYCSEYAALYRAMKQYVVDSKGAQCAFFIVKCLVVTGWSLIYLGVLWANVRGARY